MLLCGLDFMVLWSADTQIKRKSWGCMFTFRLLARHSDSTKTCYQVRSCFSKGELFATKILGNCTEILLVILAPYAFKSATDISSLIRSASPDSPMVGLLAVIWNSKRAPLSQGPLTKTFSSAWLHFRFVLDWSLRALTWENLQLQIHSLFLSDINLLPDFYQLYNLWMSLLRTWEPSLWNVITEGDNTTISPSMWSKSLSSILNN